MSWRASAYVKDLRYAPNGASLTRSEKVVLYGLADSYNDDDRYARPYMSRLAEQSLLSPRRCQQVCRSLEAKGVLRIAAQFDSQGRSMASHYYMPDLAQIEGVRISPVKSPTPMGVTANRDECAESQTLNNNLQEDQRSGDQDPPALGPSDLTPAPILLSKKSRATAHDAQSEFDPPIKLPRARALRESDLASIRAEFAALSDLEECIAHCLGRTPFQFEKDKPEALRRWLRRDFDEMRKGLGRYRTAHDAQSGQPVSKFRIFEAETEGAPA